MDSNLIEIKSNEYAYFNDTNIIVIETDSDALYSPDSVIKEIIFRKNELKILNEELQNTKQLKHNLKLNMLIYELLNFIIYGSSGIYYGALCIPLAGLVSIPIIPTVIYFLLLKSLLLVGLGTRVKKFKELKKINQQIKFKQAKIENYKKQIKQLKNKIGYKVIAKIPIEEYKKRCSNIKLKENNKLGKEKYYFDEQLENIIISEEKPKVLSIGQKKNEK